MLVPPFVTNGDASSYRGALADALTFEDAKCTFVTNGYASSYRGALADALADIPAFATHVDSNPVAAPPVVLADQPSSPSSPALAGSLPTE